jgi:hypothetical protein
MFVLNRAMLLTMFRSAKTASRSVVNVVVVLFSAWWSMSSATVGASLR